MGSQTLWSKIRKFIGRTGWSLFIWAEFRGKEKEYRDLVAKEHCRCNQKSNIEPTITSSNTSPN